MPGSRSLLIGSLLLSFLLLPLTSQNHGAAEVNPALLQKGKTLFEQECSVCHGTEGKGDGKAAYLLFPQPRDFTKGVFKVRSTPTGEPPTDQDLFNTINKGLPGSAMPGFSSLQEDDRWALVQYVQKIAHIEGTPERVIKVTAAPTQTPELLSQGKALYQKLKCWECHGTEGKGDGPSAPELKDDSGYPAPPNNFTRGIYKGGGDESDIYLRFTTGMDGSPMPSYEDSANEQERWILVHYVKSLAGGKVAQQPGTGKITVKKITGEIGEDPNDKVWNDVAIEKIPLMLLWQVEKAIDSVKIKAVHNEKEIAFLLEWEDAEPAGRFTRHQDFSDAAAIMFSLSPQPPHFTMGSKNKPVNIWYWRMDRQQDLKKFQDLEDLYPQMVADDYLFASGWYPKKIEAPGTIPTVLSYVDNLTYVTGWGAGNYSSNPKKLTAIEDLNAEGFRTLTSQKVEDQNVAGQGIWTNGYWKVLFKRSLKSSGLYDIDLNPGSKIPVAFAVWDGNSGDRDGQKSVTTWYELDWR